MRDEGGIFLPQTSEILRAQITKIITEQHQLLQPPHLHEEIFGNFFEEILAQMQFENFRETVKSVRVNALNFVRCEIQDDEIPQIPKMLFVDVSYQILFEEEALEMHQIVKGVGCDFVFGD
jgi:hypothetical protein